MLRLKDLERPDDELSELLRKAAIEAEDNDDAPDGLVELGPLFQLDDEVRNGGFAQFFFNPSCAGALDAWLSATDTHPAAATLLASALKRFGAGFRADLDIEALAKERGSAGLFPLLTTLMDVRERALGADSDPVVAFGAFRDAMAEGHGDLLGFDELNARFWRDTNVDEAALKRVRDEPGLFVEE